MISKRAIRPLCHRITAVKRRFLYRYTNRKPTVQTPELSSGSERILRPKKKDFHAPTIPDYFAAVRRPDTGLRRLRQPDYQRRFFLRRQRFRERLRLCGPSEPR